MKKKILCLLLALCACGSATTAFAQEVATPPVQDPSSEDTAILILEDGETAECFTIVMPDGSTSVVSPRFATTRRLTSSISRKGSTVYCSATARPYSGYNLEVSIILQRSTDDSTWSNVKTWDSTVTNTSKDTIIEKSTTITSGYYYRTLVRASGYENGTDKYIEGMSVTSSSIEY